MDTEPFKVVKTKTGDGRTMLVAVNAAEEQALRDAGRPVKVKIDEHGNRRGKRGGR